MVIVSEMIGGDNLFLQYRTEKILPKIETSIVAERNELKLEHKL